MRLFEDNLFQGLGAMSEKILFPIREKGEQMTRWRENDGHRRRCCIMGEER